MNDRDQGSGALKPTPAGWWHYLLVGALAAVIVFWRLGATTMDDHECKLALAARTMAQADPDPWLLEGVYKGVAYRIPQYNALNRWLVPVENGRPRLVKTPLPYWCVALPAAVGGAGVSGLTARVPSAVAAVLLAIVTLALGRRMFSKRAALFGALMLVVCVGFQKWGRNARPEMLLCLFMTVAMACFYFGLEDRTRGRRIAWMAAFWVAMGLGNLSKEFVPLLLVWPLAAYLFWRRSAEDRDDARALGTLRVFLIAGAAGLAGHLLAAAVIPKAAFLTAAIGVGLPVLWYMLRTRGWRSIRPIVPTALPGVAVMFGMFLPWMWYMSRLFPDLAGGVFAHQLTARAAGKGGWVVERPWYYLVPLVTFTLPWLGLLPGAFAAPLMKRFREHRRGLVFLLLWSVGIVALFTAAAGKREHYILPMLPAICLLMGFIAEDVFFRHAWIRAKLSRTIGVAYGFVGLIAPVVLAVLWHMSRRPGAWSGALGRLGCDGPPEWARKMIRGAVEAAPMWEAMFYVSLLAGSLMVVAGVLAWRRRLARVVALIAASTAVVYLGFWNFADRWDDRRAIRDFATSAAEIVGDAPICHWGDPQAKTTFYFGRYVPAAQWRFERSKAQRIREGTDPALAAADAQRRWRRWIEDREHAPWIITYEGKYDRKTGRVVRTKQAAALERLGYRIVLEKQGMEKKAYLFALYRREKPR